MKLYHAVPSIGKPQCGPETYKWTTKPVIIFNSSSFFFLALEFVTCSKLVQDQIFKVSPFSELLRNGQKENVTRVIFTNWDKGPLVAIRFFRTAAQPCIKWESRRAGEQESRRVT